MMRRRALLAASQTGGGSDSGPITFTVEGWDGVVTSYTIPHSMTWEEFINSDLNETKTDIYGHIYKQFVIKKSWDELYPAYACLYEGEYDYDAKIRYSDGSGYVKKDELIKPTQYIAN
jgi:hypothetical protein